MSERVLVTGAAGVLGVRLSAGLRDAGFAVRGVILPNDPGRAHLERLGAEVFEADIADREALRGCCADVDRVFHLAAIIISHDKNVFARVNRDGTAHVLEEADREGVRHFVYVSSASVTYPKRTPYAESKLEAEELVKRRRGAFTIVRPTLVYDEHGGQELRMFLDYLQRFPIVPFIGDGSGVKRPVLSDDIVDGLLRLARSEIGFGKTYNFSGDEPITMLEFARLLLRHHAAERPIVHLPVGFCCALARVLPLVMERPPLTLSAIAGIVNHADLDPGEAKRELGYRPIGVRAGFARCFPLGSAIAAEEAASPRTDG